MIKTKFRAGKYMVPMTLEYKDDRVYFHFAYNKILVKEIKECFEQRKWHGPPIHPNGPKIWSAPITQRNIFQIEDMKGKYGSDPYAKYDSDLDLDEVQTWTDRRGYKDKPYKHQIQMTAHGLSVQQFVWAAEMGTGKTLSAFMLMEMSGLTEWIWVGPKSALRAVKEEVEKWDLQVQPIFTTYEGLKRITHNWSGEAPEGIIFDEGSLIKTPTSQRSVAAKYMADCIREEHGDAAIIGLLSGTPAPRSPVDWWHLCETICPGFLREANVHLFRARLGIFEERENLQSGGKYSHHLTWRDDVNKCNRCGEPESDGVHHGLFDGHSFIPSKNEVAALKKRTSGLVLVLFKKDCLDLPDKRYEIIRLKPSAETLNAARLIIRTSTRAITALTDLRTLSDGFQYRDTLSGEDLCPLCKGQQEYNEYFDPAEPNVYNDQDWAKQGIKIIYDGEGNYVEEHQIKFEIRRVTCTNCDGKGVVPTYSRSVVEVGTPKDDALREQLDLHQEVGRLNIYGGFTATIDRICRAAHSEGWTTIRADGRGWEGKTPIGESLPADQLLKIYDRGQASYPRIAFVGQPGAAGMGLTLTASPTTIFYSNDFNGQSRMQAEDRGHRIGMDSIKGGRIIDFIHLESDEYVLQNLQKKVDLQKLSMTGLEGLFNVSAK